MFILCNCDLAAPPPPHSLAPRGLCPPALPTMKYLLPLSNLFNSFSASTLCMSYKSI